LERLLINKKSFHLIYLLNRINLERNIRVIKRFLHASLSINFISSYFVRS
jgi:hypothetical protein